jgi:general stress protein YciG
MDEARQRAIARQGGKAAHVKGTAHEFSSEEARAAGRKGGETVSQDREHMAEIGRKGGENSRGGKSDDTRSDSASSSGARNGSRDRSA